MACIFCSIPAKDWLLHNKDYYVMYDKRPVSKGHCLIVSRRHVEDYFGLREEESASLKSITLELKRFLDEKYKPKAYNLAMNCGAKAGQTVFHFHMHVIPRY